MNYFSRNKNKDSWYSEDNDFGSGLSPDDDTEKDDDLDNDISESGVSEVPTTTIQLTTNYIEEIEKTTENIKIDEDSLGFIDISTEPDIQESTTIESTTKEEEIFIDFTPEPKIHTSTNFSVSFVDSKDSDSDESGSGSGIEKAKPHSKGVPEDDEDFDGSGLGSGYKGSVLYTTAKSILEGSLEEYDQYEEASEYSDEFF